MKPLRFRQIHLDFHTSEKIENIGKDFDKGQFQDMLRGGHIDSITVFSKCHHGWAYHPTKANQMHPHLEFDLLGSMIEAAHEIGVNTPIYISAGLDEKVTRSHPEWLYRKKDESTSWASDFNNPGFHLLCFNSPYLEVLLSQIEEVVTAYDGDGIFLDIVSPKPCYCQNCVQTLLFEGKDPYNEENAIELGERVYANYTKRVRETIDVHKPGLPVFHNAGHITKGRHDLIHMNTHLELESLPTGGWGYDHFPLSARYAQTLGMDFLGMTGKFHTSWGEFGGFKHPYALKYETSLSIANGSKCSIGDQLHPSGFMDPLTYDIIGEAYREIEVKEPWISHVVSVADIGLLSFESVNPVSLTNQNSDFPMDIGANRMLLQSHMLYDILDIEADFDKYKVLILPDTVRLNNTLRKKIQDFLSGGGKVLATGESGLDVTQNEFVLDLGVKWESKCLSTPKYLRPNMTLPTFNGSSFVFYSDAEKVSLTNGLSEGRMEQSYFNRSTFHFCSHQHAPNSGVDDGPGFVVTSNSIYIPWKIFSDFANMGSLPQREILNYALDVLLNNQKTLTTNLPSQGIVTMMSQPEKYRDVIHVLYASPVLRGHSDYTGKNIEVIEDLIPISNTMLLVKTNRSVKSIYLAPQMTPLSYIVEDGLLEVVIDEFTCHQMVVIEYHN
jgi:hypothetical protein